MNLLYCSIIGISLLSLVRAKVIPEITCTPDTLDVRVNRDEAQNVELEKWNSIPGCESTIEEDSFLVRLKLNEDLPCGTTRIRNKLTGEFLYYHKLAITDKTGNRYLYKVSCFISKSRGFESNIVKRNVLPSGFIEPDYIEITSEVTGTAPIPELSVGVRQGGNLIGDHVTVSPGAPLTMEVYLDSESASIYGILVSYMMVTDTSDKNETIIFNGCTQDRYVFENFQTKDGDFLTAKFRAFKFPESNYLLFRGTVDVCLDKCQGIQCSSGDIGYGRRRRAIPDDSDPKKIFEVTMMTFIKLKDEPLHEIDPLYEFTNRHIASDRGPSFSYEKDQLIELTDEENIEEEESPSPSPPISLHINDSSSVFSSILLLISSLVVIKSLS